MGLEARLSKAFSSLFDSFKIDLFMAGFLRSVGFLPPLGDPNMGDSST